MNILAIETSCDETAAAVVEDGVTVRSNVIATAQQTFAHAGGVIPEEAARRQIEFMIPTLHEALAQASVTVEDIDTIAVTRGPGLLGSLLVGATTARALASLWKKPIVGVHHTLGHLSSTWLETKGEEPQFPVLTLSASGGHTDLWYRTSHTHGTLLGRTRDDAAGEAFDKGAALLGLPYPGGPAISETATTGDPEAFDFPLPLRGDETLDFSFSGLKTALKYLLRDLENEKRKTKNETRNIAASYQHALCRHLVHRIEKALKEYPNVTEVHIVGGVSANEHLRVLVAQVCDDRRVRFPQKISYCTDNAAMIAAAAFFLIQEKGDEAYEGFETAAAIPLKEVIR